ncbi:class I SAM-dependent methyltransferase [Tepidamorphus sp. 3E244]|uniref:class I SAM-dependent methyltransferase n=1 Tax=Tepidamorphus sp. 3E244 TaxID=3385498 RepID=UPI0038FC5DD1
MTRRYRGMSVSEMFGTIYRDRIWAGPSFHGQPFFSGEGSHAPELVEPYVAAVRAYLASLGAKPSAVDIGCGDFNVGQRIRPFCGTYTACDVVEPLIAHNREAFGDLDVDFRVLDITREAPPRHDVMFIRQVLQHLSNKQIKAALPNIRAGCRYLVLTEHLPDGKFKANRDRPAGPDIRLLEGSGVVLTQPPFNLAVRTEQVLWEGRQFGGIIRTTAYDLGDDRAS